MTKPFSDDVLRAIRERIELVDLVSTYVTLKRTGQNAVGLCPFHTEKRPSFSVSPSKQLFHCFGCGVGGDVFQFVMQRESLGFSEAVQMLARKAGIALPTRDSTLDRRRETLYAIHRAAVDHFRQRLNGRNGDAARRYLLERRLTLETVEAFGLGYASSSWDDLLTALSDRGWTPAQIEETGVVKPRPHGSGWYDFFRHRIIFPIRDVHQNVIAFGGRVLDDSQPKYLNSPETLLFSKGRHLFGLDRARQAVAETGTLVVVEGYFDVISAHQAGLAHVVAPLGTALTSDHVAAIRRLVKRMILVFDPDPAGVRAALRTIDLFGAADIRVDVAELPGGKDPDLLIAEDGVEAFRAALEASRSLVTFVLEHLVPEVRYRGVEEKKGAAARALPVIAKLSNTIERDHYRAWLADRIGVAEASLRENHSPSLLPRGTDRGPTAPPKRPRAQEVVGAALVQGRLGFGRVRELGPEPFTDPSLHEFIAFVCSPVAATWPVEPDPGFADRIWPLIRENQVLAGVVSDLAVVDLTEEELDQEIEDCWKKLWAWRFKDRISDVARQIAQKDAAGDHEGLPDLQRELDRLKQAVL